MKILFFSAFFFPKVGGLEKIALSLAEDLSNRGHFIKLVTLTPLGSNIELNSNFEIIRNPSKKVLFENYLWCDTFFHHHLSLNGIWPYFIYPKKKTFVLNQLTYDNHGHSSLSQKIKRQLTRFFINISCSNYVNSTLPKKGEVIWNSYDDQLIKNYKNNRIENSIVFLGRLVSDKGCDVLIKALILCIKKKPDINFKLTIIGEGPEASNLLSLIKSNSIEKYVTFKGTLLGEELVAELNKHQMMVIPSVWKEPFGIVALEALACGCLPIFSDGGGLKEACGDYGLSFNRGSIANLSEKIGYSLNKYHQLITAKEERIEQHLLNFKREQVAIQFEALIIKNLEN